MLFWFRLAFLLSLLVAVILVFSLLNRNELTWTKWNNKENGTNKDPSHAFVVLCANIKIVLPCLVLFQQLEIHSGQIPKVALVLEDLVPQISPILNHFRIRWRSYKEDKKISELVGYRLSSSSTRQRDSLLWNKLWLWNLIEFEKIVSLDADMLILADIGELFGVKSQFAAVPMIYEEEKIIFWEAPAPFQFEPLADQAWQNLSRAQRPEVFHSGMNGGLMLLQPCHSTFEGLLAALPKIKERMCCPTQEFLFRYFELLGEYRRLPMRYNMRKIHRQTVEGGNKPLVKVYHFVERRKPWMMSRAEAQEDYYADLWWRQADLLGKRLARLIHQQPELTQIITRIQSEMLS